MDDNGWRPRRGEEVLPTVSEGVTGDGTRRVRPALTIWVYDSPMGAAAGEVRLLELVRRGGVTVVDAVTATWVAGAHRPRVGHLRGRPSDGASRGGLLGLLVDALTDASLSCDDRAARLAGQLAGTGVEEPFVLDACRRIVPGTSALLVISSDADLDLVRPVIEHGRARGDVVLFHAFLTPDGLDRLRAAMRATGQP